MRKLLYTAITVILMTSYTHASDLMILNTSYGPENWIMHEDKMHYVRTGVITYNRPLSDDERWNYLFDELCEFPRCFKYSTRRLSMVANGNSIHWELIEEER
ncbi:hypothetical protein C4565_00340 [Candidatus Parcubacteria bacterium]|nr:MAG: hypothetical protein C4565_00340 [Candidatus Parcubacteria bacterium]